MTQLFSQTISPGTGGYTSPLIFGGRVGKANAVVNNTSTVALSFIYLPDNAPVNCPANAVTPIPDFSLSFFQLTGTGTASVVLSWPEEPEPQLVNIAGGSASISGTVTASLATGTTVAVSSISSTVGVSVGTSDLATSFTGGSAPRTGVWTLSFTGTTGPSINGVDLPGTFSASALYTITIAVTQGSAYVVGGSGISVTDGSVR